MTEAVAIAAQTAMRPVRLPALDFARGIAILAVIAYHFCWDLEDFGIHYFGLFEAPFWLFARTVIAGAFLVIAGIGLVLAAEGGIDRRRYGIRLAKIVAGAAIVTAATYWNYPQAGVFFGILHHIAVASVIGLAFLRLPWWLTLAAAAGVIALDYAHQDWLSAPWLLWLGMGTGEVWAVDYVPLVPWFSGVLIGIALARLALSSGAAAALAAWPLDGVAGCTVRFLGRHTLIIYLVHQPILFGLFFLWFYLTSP
ncbi:MAG: heparan-alpha-glucosaminide N-acetyltransferase [Alphaproteobacteria bacterium]